MIIIILQSIAIIALLYVSFICMQALNNKKSQIDKEKNHEQ